MLGLRHYQRRKKAPPKEPFSLGKSLLKNALDLLIYPAAIASPLALLPQALNLYATHDAHSLVLATWAILGCLNILWLLYGIVHKEWPIIITNAALMVLNFSIMFGVLLYA